MNELRNVQVGPMNDSIYLRPMEMRYTLNGVEKKWDYMRIHDSVNVIIFNITRNVFVCVKQFRPPVYLRHVPLEAQKCKSIDVNKYPPKLGVSVEFCAGIIDKNLTFEEIAKAEIMEETGYDVPLEKLEKVRTYSSNVGPYADEVHMYYVEVEDHMKTGKGGGLSEEGEFIEIVDIPVNEAKRMCEDRNLDNYFCGLLYGLLWFFHFKAPTLKLE